LATNFDCAGILHIEIPICLLKQIEVNQTISGVKNKAPFPQSGRSLHTFENTVVLTVSLRSRLQYIILDSTT